ncbi:hypothetical protein GCM10008943_31930 [Paenochrobactrum glaciei]|uniref:Autotransporter domain-containing protein n=2 Tax=Paenochrobactrum glaciei TaxID=486407 RepID=A0ABN1GLZ9_9HYPH
MAGKYHFLTAVSLLTVIAANPSLAACVQDTANVENWLCTGSDTTSTIINGIPAVHLDLAGSYEANVGAGAAFDLKSTQGIHVVDKGKAIYGKDYGLLLENTGAGDINILSDSDITQGGYAEQKDYSAVRIRNNGIGKVKAEFKGNINGGYGIYANVKNDDSDVDLMIRGDVNSHYAGILVDLNSKNSNTNITTYGKIISESGQGISVINNPALDYSGSVNIEAHDYIYGYNHGIGVEASGVVRIVTHDSVIGQNTYYWDMTGSRMVSPSGFMVDAMVSPSYIYEDDALWGITGDFIDIKNSNLIGNGGVQWDFTPLGGFGIGVINNINYADETASRATYIQTNGHVHGHSYGIYSVLVSNGDAEESITNTVIVNGNVSSNRVGVYVSGGYRATVDLSSEIRSVGDSLSIDGDFGSTLILRNGWAMNKQASTFADENIFNYLVLHGDENSKIDMARVGDEAHEQGIVGFQNFIKEGESTWELNGKQIDGGFETAQINHGALWFNNAHILMDANGEAAHINKNGAIYASGTSSIEGSLLNAGLLSLSKKNDDVAGTKFTVNNYQGAGGLLELNTVLGDDNSETDILMIGGDSAGETIVKVNNVGGTGAQTKTGIKIIDVAGQSEGKFNLKGDYNHKGEEAVVAGAYAYVLHQNNSTSDKGSWYLHSSLKKEDPSVDPEKPEPKYNPGASIYEVYPQFLLGLNTLPTMQQRVGNRYWDNAGNKVLAQGADAVDAYAPPAETGSFTQGSGVWGRVEGTHNKMQPNTSTSDATYDYNTFKMQAGIDGLLNETENGKLIGGLTAHYSHGKVNIGSKHGDGDIKTDGYGLGGTLTWYGDHGFYVDGQGQLAWYKSDLYSSAAKRMLKDGNNGFGYALSLETGQRITLDDQWSVTPQAQLQYSNVDFDSFRDVFKADVSREKGDSLRARLGLSVDYQNSWQNAQGLTNRSMVYGIANLYNEFLDGTKVRVSTVDFINKSERFWGGIGFGGSYNWNDDKYSIYGEGSINTSFKNFGDSYNYQGTVGLRVKW